VKKTRQKSDQNVDLVIFGCDGVLVDSEVISCRTHADVLTRHGYPITARSDRANRPKTRPDRWIFTRLAYI
jgi:beta-phosphoglucomutase-like phosphatase (HAD superfamily)